MDRSAMLKTLSDIGALITNDHIVYKSGRHGSAYVNKDAIYPHTHLTAELCGQIARNFRGKNIEVVVGPAMGGVILSTWIAYFLQTYNMTHRVPEVVAVYADKDGEGFAFKRGYGEFVKNKRVLVTEDVLTTGGSAKQVVDLVTSTGGSVYAVGALVNRGKVTAKMLGAPRLSSLIDVNLDSYTADDCPFCKNGVPVNTIIGHGKEFLEHCYEQ